MYVCMKDITLLFLITLYSDLSQLEASICLGQQFSSFLVAGSLHTLKNYWGPQRCFVYVSYTYWYNTDIIYYIKP